MTLPVRTLCLALLATTIPAAADIPSPATIDARVRAAMAETRAHGMAIADSVVCPERGRRCVLLLANDVRAEARFADLVRFVLGATGVPYDWEYGDYAGKS